MTNQFDTLVFDRTAQFYGTLTLEQKVQDRYSVYPSDFCFLFKKRYFITNFSMEFRVAQTILNPLKKATAWPLQSYEKKYL